MEQLRNESMAMLRRLSSLGIDLVVKGGRLTAQGQTRLLTPADKESITDHKDDLIAALQEREAYEQELMGQVGESLCWLELEILLAQSMDAYSDGRLSREQAEIIAERCADHAQTIPSSWGDVKLRDFDRATGKSLEIKSKKLNDRFTMVSGSESPSKFAGRIVYKASELAELLDVPEEQLKSIHLVKKELDGEVLPAPVEG